MYKIVSRLCLAVFATFSIQASEPGPPKTPLPLVAAMLTPTRISEDREKDLAKMDLSIVHPRQLTLTVRVEGDDFKETRAWGDVVVAAAGDDTGRDLRIPRKKPKPKSAKRPASDDDDDDDVDPNEGFTIIEPRDGQDDRELLVDIGLSLPARKATRIVRVRGQFTVMRGGEVKEVAADHLLDLMGKSISDPVLKEAGVELLILPGDKPEDKKATASDASFFKVRILGNPMAVLTMKVFGEKGNSASNSSDYTTPGLADHEAERDFGLNQALNNTMVLKIQVTVGQQAVRVPFDLKDIVLP